MRVLWSWPVLPLTMALLGACAGSARPRAQESANGLAIAATLKGATDGLGEPRKASLPIGPPAPRWIPDLSMVSGGTVEVLPGGVRRLLVAGFRMTLARDGAVSRSVDALPDGGMHTLELPPRLGGGFVFATASSTGTQIWKAPSWTAPLTPLASIAESAQELVAGPDRLFVRGPNGDLLALDPQSGQRVPLLGIPTATRVGGIAFLDAYRGAVVTDLRGALLTLDAGQTFHPLDLGTPLPGAGASQRTLTDPIRALSAAGKAPSRREPQSELPSPSLDRPLPFACAIEDPARSPSANIAAAPSASGERCWLGEGSPLRAAILSGVRMGDDAVVARQGNLYRVALASGALLQVVPGAYPDSAAQCSGFQGRASPRRLFVCGASTGETTLFELSDDLAMRLIAAYATPRKVSFSRSSAALVSGPCDPRLRSSSEAACVHEGNLPPREVRFDLASVRTHMVLLDSGEVVRFWVQPGAAAKEAQWVLEVTGRGGVRERRTASVPDLAPKLAGGYFLDSFEQWDARTLAGYLQREQSLVGVRIHLEPGGGGLPIGLELSEDAVPIDQTWVSGAFGLSRGRIASRQTVDFGMTWPSTSLPPGDVPFSDSEGRGCSSIGCAGGGWLRVGYGGGGDDWRPAEVPSVSPLPRATFSGLSWRCEPMRVGAVPPQAKASSSAVSPSARPTPPGPASPSGPASPKLFPETAPARGPLQVRSDRPSLVSFQIVASGLGGAHTGRWLARYDDRFSFLGARSTSESTPPSPDEEAMAERLGLQRGTIVNFSALLDPGGHAALLVGRRGLAHSDVYGAVEGEPLVALQDVAGRHLPEPQSAVHVGSKWYFLSALTAQAPGPELFLWEADSAGNTRYVTHYPRLPGITGDPPVRLVKRSTGEGVGLLTVGAPLLGRARRDLYILPLREGDGALMDPILLGGSAGQDWTSLRTCGPDEDGWLADLSLTIPPGLRVAAADPPSLSNPELRVRFLASGVCIDSLAARVDTWSPKPFPRRMPPALQDSVPLVVTEASTGRRYELACHP